MLTDEERVRIAELEKRVFDGIDVIVGDAVVPVEDRLRALAELRLDMLLNVLKHADPSGKISAVMRESIDRVLDKLDEAEEKIWRSCVPGATCPGG